MNILIINGSPRKKGLISQMLGIMREDGIRELTVHNPARRTFLINLTWKFNEARSKYRGSGAGEKQKARM